LTQIKIQQFEGPLDLLLSLIEQQQLNITEISLAHVTEQFLNYVKELEKIDATQVADYLGIAAKLLVIKSKAILPSLEIDTPEEEAEEDLTEKLLRYKQFKEAAKYFKQLDTRGLQSFTRTRVFSERINFWPDPGVDLPILQQAIGGVLDSLRELDNLPKAKIREAISIQERIQALQQHLSSQIETKLSDLLKNAKNKEDVIITFLALLELIKQRMFSVNQDELFTDITIRQYTLSEADPEESAPEGLESTATTDHNNSADVEDEDDEDEEMI
jgi:segregation and condensation protein A